MSYTRVLPRDLFNEGNLLKCYGALWIALDDRRGHNARFSVEDVYAFEIEQRPDDGSLVIENIQLIVGDRYYALSRPLNSRRPYPLYAEWISAPDADPVEVFNDDGTLTVEFGRLIGLQPILRP